IIYVAILVLVVAGTTFGQTREEAASVQNPNEQSLPLIGILFGLGRDYNSFFTIEEGALDGEPSNKLESEWTRRTLGKSNLFQELEQLRQNVPDFSYEFDSTNPRIVHIIDARLKRQKGYGLEQTIKTIDFTGTVNELLSEIGKHGIPVSARTGG